MMKSLIASAILTGILSSSMCQIQNLCSQEPCKYNGTCETTSQGGYLCRCLTGDPLRDCDLNDEDECQKDPPNSPEKYIACIDLIGTKEMLCAPAFNGTGCLETRDPANYCSEHDCYNNSTDVCKPLCNRKECNGTEKCNFTAFNSETYLNVSENCRRLFADGYSDPGCETEENLFDGSDSIRNQLKDCSPFFETICTKNISDGVCNPHCNNSDCLWDGMDCINDNLQTFDGSVFIELEQHIDALSCSRLELVLRSGLQCQQHYSHGERPKLQVKVVKPESVPNAENSTMGQFTSVQSAGLFLAAFIAKLPLDVNGITDVYVCEAGHFGRKCFNTCSKYCTKQGDICDFVTGECLYGCRTRWWGDQCLEQCPRGCSGECNRDNGSCRSCVIGRYGDYNCSKDCDSYCRYGTCNGTTGECDCGERRYYSAEHANCSECSEGCETNCSSAGDCTCKPGYFGPRCDAKCGSNCKSGTCDEVDGHCRDCKSGFYGERCNKECGEGCTDCQQESGSCAGKCKDGYVGNDCQRSTQPVTDNTGVIVAVVIALLIIITIIIIAICYWRYRESGDYIVKERYRESGGYIIKNEVDDEPVKKVTSQEVKAHYGMQPIHSSPLSAQSSDMIDMDEKQVGGVYAGPAVTITFSKEDDTVEFGEENRETPQTVVRETEERTGHDIRNDEMSNNSTQDGDAADANAAENVDDSNNIKVKMNVSNDNDVSENQNLAKNEDRQEYPIRAPLASEEDLTALQVLKDDETREGKSSLDSLEKAAIDVLEDAGNEASSSRSSKSSSSSISISSDKDKDGQQQLLTEM